MSKVFATMAALMTRKASISFIEKTSLTSTPGDTTQSCALTTN
jgi:hypothetical protein